MWAVQVLRTVWTLRVAAWMLSALLSGRGLSAQEPMHCRLGFTACKDGSTCVLNSHVCDNEMDCADGSDEEGCPSNCTASQFQCAHGRKCIEKKQLCDDYDHCQDRSDEAGCFIPDEGCFHRCSKQLCVSQSFVCDGDQDCEDGSDEADCGEGACDGTEFQCRSGQCVSSNMHCDGYPDCPDRSDEDGCISLVECTAGQHRCLNNQQCVLQEWLCDGENDCKDMSDEQNCTESVVQCGDFQWLCASQTQCVPQTWRCDGTKDCRDESDESGCAAVSCRPDQFQCDSLECLDPSLLCDGNADCADKSDEGGACSTDSCPEKLQCEHNCYSTPKGSRCWCRKGYEPVDDGVKCVDVDECVKTPDACDHLCTNSDGSYACSCVQGYVLEPDGRSCKSKDVAHLLASVHSKIFLLDLGSSSLELLSQEKGPVISLDYDWKEQKVYWVSMGAETVMWTTLDRKSRGTLTQGIQAECIAVDWVGRNLYWTDGAEGRINVVGLERLGVEPVVIVEDDVDELRSLVLLPQKGVMFWSETGAVAQIERAGMDGSNRQVLTHHSLQRPVGLAVDLLHNRLYWTDEKLRCIGSVTLDGEDIKILQLMETLSPFSVAVFENVMYWSDVRRGTIEQAQRTTGKQQVVLLKRLRQSFSLKVIHVQQQPDVENPCVSKHCSHLCVLTPGLMAMCKCPPQFLLEDDGLTCSKSKGGAFLLFLSPSSIALVQDHHRSSGVDLQDWPEHQKFDLPELKTASALDLVLSEKMLYILDSAAGSLGLFKIKDAAITWHGTLLKLKKGSIAAMAVDYITLNVFWSSKGQPGVYVSSANGVHTTLIIDQDMVHAIALHPPTGRMCFSDTRLQRTATHLECAFMDGRNRTVVWDGAVNPISLTFSNDGTMLYWADTSLGLITSTRIDGSEHKSLSCEEPVVAFTLANNVLVWLTKTDSTKCWFSEDHQTATMWFKVKTEVLDIKAFCKPNQNAINLCAKENGGCSQLCLAFPGGRTCRCGRGFLPVNEKSCTADPLCPSGTKPCLHGEKCVDQEKFCDGQPDCPDDSDEICVHDQAESSKAVDPKLSPISPSQLPGQSASIGSVVVNKDLGAKLPKSSPVPEAVAPPKSHRPDSNDLKVENVDSQSCETRLCNGNGVCVMLDGKTTCECALGYGGENCEQEIGGLMQGPIIYAIAGLAAGVVIIGVIVGLIKKTASRRRAPIVRETSMRDLSKLAEPTTTQQKKLIDPEEPEDGMSSGD